MQKISNCGKVLVLTGLLSLLLTAFVFGAGGNGGQAAQETPEISFLVMDYGRDKIDEELYVFKVMEEKIGVKVIPIPIVQSEFEAKFNTLVASGNLPDLVSCPLNTAQKYGPDGLFVDFKPVLSAKLPNLAKLMKAYPEIEASITAEDGSFYSLPQIKTEFGYEWVIGLRKDLLAALNMNKDSIQTLDDLYGYLQKTKGMLGGLIEGWIPANAGTTIISSRPGNLGAGVPGAFSFDDSKDAFFYGPLTGKFKTYMEFLNKCYTNGLLHPDMLSFSRNENKERFWQGKSSMFFYPEYLALGEYTIELKKFSGNDSFEWTTIWPVAVNGEKYIPRRDHSVGSGSYDKSIFAKSKNIDAVYKFVNYVYGDEGSKVFYWGDEGKHYKYDAKGQLEWLVKYTWNEDRVSADAKSYVDFGLANVRYILLRNYHPRTPEMINIYETLVSKYSDVVALPEPQIMSVLTAEERDEYSNVMTPVNTYVTENCAQFMMGQRPMSEWSDFIAGLKKLNVETVLDRYNTIYKERVK